MVKKASKPCHRGGERGRDGNCSLVGEDGLPLQCVGPWVATKHNYLSLYIEATKAARGKFVRATPERPRVGGAAFIDLFAGPGRAHLDSTGEEISGSPLIALAHEGSPFSTVISCEKSSTNANALRQRTESFGARSQIIVDDCNNAIDKIVGQIPEHGLNVALIDPYGLEPLHFETIAALARVKRMDFIIHFPTGTIKRNLKGQFSEGSNLDRFLGTDAWRERVQSYSDVVGLIDVLREQLEPFGYLRDHVHSLEVHESIRAPSISNRKGAIMYHLIFATKQALGNKIWQSITSNVGTQMSFPI